MRLLASCTVVAAIFAADTIPAWSAEGVDGTLPPAAPAGLPAALPPALPVAAPTPVPFDAGAGVGALPGFDAGAGAGLPGAVPTPPPLTALGNLPTDAPVAGTTESISSAGGPIETYEFLFREDEDRGVLRDKYEYNDAQALRRQEIQRLITKYQPQGQGNQAPQQQQGADPRAGAEWDFYFEQLDMYSRYVHEKLLPAAKDLPEPTFDAQNNAQIAQDRDDLKANFNTAAVDEASRQFNENREFYDRLADREQRRRDFGEWLDAEQRKLDEWTGLWARKVNGTRWTDGEPVRRDDWYYGVDFNTRSPISMIIDQREYLLSRTPQNHVPDTQLNVVSQNFSPYDIIDATGSLKNPEMEKLRGTLVIPPVLSNYTSRTIEMVP